MPFAKMPGQSNCEQCIGGFGLSIGFPFGTNLPPRFLLRDHHCPAQCNYWPSHNALSYPSLLGFRLSLLSTPVRYCLAFGGGRRLLKDQLDGDIATGGIGVGADRVGDRDQFFAYGPLHSRQLDVQLDL